LGFPGGSDCKESAFSAGDLGLIPRLGRSPAEGDGYPHQYSGLENSMNREAWGFPLNSVNKESTSNAGDTVSIPGMGRSLGDGNGNPLVILPGKSHGKRSLVGSQRVGHNLVTKQQQKCTF